MGALLSLDDEPEVMEWGRLTELQRRNTLCLPHLKSSYPVEVQTRGPKEMEDDRLRTGSPGEAGDSDASGVPGPGQGPGPAGGRRGRKRPSSEGVPLDDSLDSCPGTSKRKVEVDGDRVYQLNTPGVRLYKHYSPNSGRVVTRRMSSQSASSTATLGSNNDQPLASYQRPGPPTPGVRGTAGAVMETPTQQKTTPRNGKRGGRGTPKGATPSSGRRARAYNRRTPKARNTPLRKPRNAENADAQSKVADKDSLAFNIGFTPSKKTRRLGRLLGGKKADDSSQVKKRPLRDSNKRVV